MLSRSTPIGEGALRRLHPETLEDPARIRALLARVRDNGAAFHRGLNRRIDLETAYLETVLEDELVLRAENFDRAPIGAQIFLNFSCDDRPYFFATRPTAAFGEGQIRVAIPPTLFFGERRDRARRAPDGGAGDPSRVEIEDGRGGFRQASVENVSPSGLGLLLDSDFLPDRPVKVRFLDGRDSGTELQLELRNRRPVEGRKGWTRIGLARENRERFIRSKSRSSTNCRRLQGRHPRAREQSARPTSPVSCESPTIRARRSWACWTLGGRMGPAPPW